MRDSDLPVVTQAIWHIIASYGTARTGDVTAYPPSLADIAHVANLERRTVVSHIKVLVESGWLLRLPGGPMRKTAYRLSSPMDPSPPFDPQPPGVGSDGSIRSDASDDRELLGVGSGGSTRREPGQRAVGSERSHYPGSPEIPGQSASASPFVAIVRKYTDATEDEALEVLEKIKKDYRPRRLGGYLKSMATAGDLPRILDDIRAARRGVTPIETLPPPCGKCDNRFIDLGDRLARCPDCHPLAVGR